MSDEYRKKAEKTPASGEDDTRRLVADMLDEIERGGEARVRHYAETLDRWTCEIVVGEAAIDAAAKTLSQRVKDDIQFAYDRVRTFAERQRASMSEFEAELSPGLFAGQKLIPVDPAGRSVQGGRRSEEPRVGTGGGE